MKEDAVLECRLFAPVVLSSVLLSTASNNSRHPDRNPMPQRLLGRNAPDKPWKVLWTVVKDDRAEVDEMEDVLLCRLTSSIHILRMEFTETQGADGMQLSSLDWQGEKEGTVAS